MKFSNAVDMAVIDYELPDFNGMELAGFLKAKWIAPIVLMTGIELPDVHHVDVVLNKPFHPGDLVPLLKSLFHLFKR
jgi:DNA-binding response OmpR family regulator